MERARSCGVLVWCPTTGGVVVFPFLALVGSIACKWRSIIYFPRRAGQKRKIGRFLGASARAVLTGRRLLGCAMPLPVARPARRRACPTPLLVVLVLGAPAMTWAQFNQTNTSAACSTNYFWDISYEACYEWCPNNPAENCKRCKCRTCDFCRVPPQRPMAEGARTKRGSRGARAGSWGSSAVSALLGEEIYGIHFGAIVFLREHHPGRTGRHAFSCLCKGYESTVLCCSLVVPPRCSASKAHSHAELCREFHLAKNSR